MDGIKAYLLSVCGAALICAIANRILENRGAVAGVGKLLIGSFLVLTILQPICELNLAAIEDFRLDNETDAVRLADQGEESTRQAIAEIIKQRTAEYIIQKAQDLRVGLEIDVVVSKDDIPVPEMVYLKGTVAPFAKQQLQQMIEQDLGIAKEYQIWT